MSDLSRKGTKGDMAHWTFQNSIENEGISQGNNGFWIPNEAANMTYNIISFQSFKFEKHEPGYNLNIKFCNLSLILWEQVSYGLQNICVGIGLVLIYLLKPNLWYLN